MHFDPVVVAAEAAGPANAWCLRLGVRHAASGGLAIRREPASGLVRVDPLIRAGVGGAEDAVPVVDAHPVAGR